MSAASAGASVRHGRSAVDIEDAREHRDGAQQRGLALRQQAVAPVERRLEGLLPQGRTTRPQREEPESVVQRLQDLRRWERDRLSGGQFDGQSIAIEAPADLCNGGRVGVRQLISRPLSRVRGEQLDGGKRPRLVGRGTLPGIAFQPTKTMQSLGPNPEGLAARREDTHAVQMLGQAVRRCSGRRQQMLAIVEHESLVLPLQSVQDPRQRITTCNPEAQR